MTDHVRAFFRDAQVRIVRRPRQIMLCGRDRAGRDVIVGIGEAHPLYSSLWVLADLVGDDEQ